MLNIEEKGNSMLGFCKKIFPYCRSITGDGVRMTLSDIKKELESFNSDIKLEIKSVPSGSKVFDWTVPKEWKISGGFIEDEKHNHIVDFNDTNLHILGYSIPVDKWVNLEELKKHVYTQIDQPNVIPYVTSYYKERYGFCMSENQKQSLKPGKYHLFIDSELFDGVLNYAECVIKGSCSKEIFFSTYICHPSMANNECSGPTVQMELMKYVSNLKNRRYTYRFIFIPETIGSITYLSQGNNLKYLKEHMIAGFNLSCVGDDRNYSIVESRYADTLADKALKMILKENGEYITHKFINSGSDERQYNAPFIELPVVGYNRTKYGCYPEYHTSSDDFNVVTATGLQGSYAVLIKLIYSLEYNDYYKVKILGEPQLGKRGLYPTISQKGNYDTVSAMMNFIKYCDGKNDIYDISNRINVPVMMLTDIIDKLKENDLIEV